MTAETDPVEPVEELVAAIGPAHRALAAAAAHPPVDLAGWRHVSEREPGVWYCCVPCSAAMVGAYLADVPPTLAAAHRIRTEAGYRHPDPGTSGGTSPSRIAAGLERAYGVALEPIALADVDDRLAAGWAMIAGLTAGDLAAPLRRWAPAFAGGHAVALAGRSSSGAWGWHDPLAPATVGGRPWTGEYASPASIVPALWATGLYGAPAPGARDMPIRAAAGLMSGQVVTLPPDRPLFGDPALTQRLTVESGPVPYIGTTTGPAAIAVLVTTRAGYPDNKPRPTVLYADPDGLPAPVTVPIVPPSAAELAKARAEGAGDMWDRWALGLGIPTRGEV